ncbi:hypothetical protein DEM27_11720 [Metarhizobium album]|uniref:MmcQ/YjbR family DNA-binding protein n=1 Tax=Metarhizobium album TaxID=2182425 RepID=A0A2U2DS05_9HYPH|nr:MmcQ/YjbR family DNA-binding protein [Rhizobium album]PWE56100.1 hypothetical protein DEM27_11720 [Rhizobium album]
MSSDLFSRDGFDAFLAGLPAVSFVDQWEAHVAKVDDKVFAALGDSNCNWGDKIVIKVSEESFEILTAIEEIGQAAYFAKRKWVSVGRAAPLGENELRHYIRRSYELVAAGLTRKRRGELSISLPLP